MANNSHGMTKTPEHYAWCHMKYRCLNPDNKHYSDYGGRGIKICDRWLNFENFFADMGSRPSPKHSLDRVDNNDNYRPGNCRWATKAEQENNKRNNRLITIEDVTLTITQWKKKMGYGENVILMRLKRGWSEYRAVMTPVRQRKKTFRKVFTVNKIVLE